MSKQVSLIPLGLESLDFKYARPMGNNKIVHYSVSAIGHLAGLSYDPFKAVADYIHSNEGLEAVLVENSSQDGKIKVSDMSEAVLKDLPNIRKALKKFQTKSLVHQWLDLMSLNDIEMKANPEDGQKSKISKFRVGLNLLAEFVGLHFLIPETYSTKTRRMTPITYLTYSYEQPDEQIAIASLRSDLQTLHRHGLIMGNLSMPSSITIADTVGAGVPRKILLCFLFVNQPKLFRKLNKHQKDIPAKPLQAFLGIQGEAFEGEIAVNLTAGKYEIETVEVYPNNMLSNEKIHQSVLLNYFESFDHINNVAQHQRELIKEYKEETKNGNKTGPIGLQIHKNHRDVIAKKTSKPDTDDIK